MGLKVKLKVEMMSGGVARWREVRTKMSGGVGRAPMASRAYVKESSRPPEHRKYATGDGRVLNDEEVVVVKEVGKKNNNNRERTRRPI